MPDLTWGTEQANPASVNIDTLPIDQVVATILAQDATVAQAVQAVCEQAAQAAELMVKAIAAGGRVHYLGAGTSGRMGVLDAVELLPTYGVGDDQVTAHIAGGPGAMAQAVEGAEDDADAGAQIVRAAGPHDLIVGIAASGRTPFVAGALAEATRRGLDSVLIAANPAAPIAGQASVAVLFDTGPEVMTGSTRMKAATAQKMILNAISTAAMIKLGHSYSNLMIDMIPTNLKLVSRSVQMLVQATGRPADQCEQAWTAAGKDVRVALISLLAGVDAQTARRLAEEQPRDPARSQDPSGVRTAVAAAQQRPVAATEV